MDDDVCFLRAKRRPCRRVVDAQVQICPFGADLLGRCDGAHRAPLETPHLRDCAFDLARTISTLARAHEATADRSAVQVQLAVAGLPEAIDLGFWRAVPGYALLHEDNCIDPLGQGSPV